MSAKGRFQHTISLSNEQERRVEKLIKKGVKLVDIFTKGLEAYEEDTA